MPRPSRLPPADPAGYTIAPKQDFGRSGFLVNGRWVKSGFVVLDRHGRNAMPGGLWFLTPEDASASLGLLLEVGLGNAQAFHAGLARLCQVPVPLAEDAGGQALRRAGELMAALGWSQSKLARRLGVDVNTVSRWFTGRVPVPRWLLEYLEALDAVRVTAVRLGILEAPDTAAG